MKLHTLKDCLRGWYLTPRGEICRAISRLPDIQGAPHRPNGYYQCNSCPVDVIKGLKNLLIHVNGRRHQMSLLSRKKESSRRKKSDEEDCIVVELERKAESETSMGPSKNKRSKRSHSPILPPDSDQPYQPISVTPKRIRICNESEPYFSTFTNVCKLFPLLEDELGVLSLDCLKLQLESIQVENLQPKRCNEIMMTPKNAYLLWRVKEKLVSLIELDMVSVDKVQTVQTVISDIKTLLQKYPTYYEHLKLSNNKTVVKEDRKKNEEIDNLSNQDLIDLVENFNDLDWTEKNNLVNYLSNLENNDPKRYELLEQEIKNKNIIED